MTPKEKAINLVNKLFYAKDEKGIHSYNGYRARQCALIAVDEILNAGKDVDEFCDSYWQDVKKEIELL